MRINIDIDDKLLQLALELGKHATKKEVVHQALVYYIRRLKQLKMLELQGMVGWEGDPSSMCV
ncbi:type II toxin-antitoxin system VapB family antitoxin [Lewinella sp. LCG006]|uniref:type II toxin-antitoxin system VapB family antitoxin n=1 Tax=Lewinella sp. LCG006 TaxID=3231911 RepID=UPI003460E173